MLQSGWRSTSSPALVHGSSGAGCRWLRARLFLEDDADVEAGPFGQAVAQGEALLPPADCLETAMFAEVAEAARREVADVTGGFPVLSYFFDKGGPHAVVAFFDS